MDEIDRPTDDAGQDLRVRRTRRMLQGALVDLALEKPFDAITVRDLTNRAGIGYATFFRHYSSKEELVRAMLQGLLGELLAKVRPYEESDPAGAALVVFRHAAQNVQLYRLLLRTSNSSVELLGEVIRVGSEAVGRSYRSRPGSTVPFEVAAQHLVRSFVNLTEWWLESGMPYSPEEMAQIFDELLRRPLLETVFELRRE